jgi:hypothetical protein
MEIAADCGRMSAKPEVIPADPIRAITSGWPTTHRELTWSFPEDPHTTDRDQRQQNDTCQPMAI